MSSGDKKQNGESKANDPNEKEEAMNSQENQFDENTSACLEGDQSIDAP